jgi:hypothetical protein
LEVPSDRRNEANSRQCRAGRGLGDGGRAGRHAKRTQFARRSRVGRGLGTRGDCAKQSQTWVGWDIWVAAHQGKQLCETKPIPGGATLPASALREKSYDESDPKEASEERSQFRRRRRGRGLEDEGLGALYKQSQFLPPRTAEVAAQGATGSEGEGREPHVPRPWGLASLPGDHRAKRSQFGDGAG